MKEKELNQFKQFLLKGSYSERHWVYDIETYPNFYCIDFFNGKEHKQFEISSRKNEIDKIVLFIEEQMLIGYNSHRFDDLVILHVYDYYKVLQQYPAESIALNLFQMAGKVIDYYQKNSKDERVKELSRMVKPFQSVDLMKTHGLQKGLKLVGVVLKWHNIQDLPFQWDLPLDVENIDIVMKYNQNDTEMTYALMKRLQKELTLRVDLSIKYNNEFLSNSDSQIGSALFEQKYEELLKLAGKYNPADDFRNKRTHRSHIALSEVILPNIKFETKSLSKLLQTLKLQSLYKQDKGFKLDIPHFEFRGKTYQMGIGGLHSEDDARQYSATDQLLIVDADVTSFYPSIIIKDKVKPEHLDDLFFDCMIQFTNERIEAKKSGDSVKADGMKIVINSTFGKMGFEGFWLYDERAMLQVTLNGQLYLLMLIEMLTDKGFEVISANTDGVVTLVPVDKEVEYSAICKEWEKKCGFNLEFKKYKKYVRTNVNNYLAVDDHDKIKYKGLFQSDISLHQGFDSPIIPIVLQKYFVNGTPVEEALLAHRDIYDFCTSQKMGGQFKAEYGNEPVQKTCRFYVSKTGKILRKWKEDEITKDKSWTVFCGGKPVQLFNQFVEKSNFDDYLVDYEFYKKEIFKVISEINKVSQSLWEDEKSTQESNIDSTLFDKTEKAAKRIEKKKVNESLW